MPFPLSEAQAAVVARMLSGRLTLPTAQEMAAWEHKKLDATRGTGIEEERERTKEVHVLGYPADAEYINFLHDWAMSAPPSNHPGVSSEDDTQTGGKQPPYWGQEACWVRERTPLIKQAARELGPKRRGEVKTLRELGFDYEGWKNKNCGEDGPVLSCRFETAERI